MKSLVHLLFAIVFCKSAAAQQWVQQNSPTTAYLKSISFSSEMTGWVVGDQGTLIKTTDGGTNWSLLATGVTSNLVTTWFVNDSKGFIGGLNGVFRKTTDGGQTWSTVDQSITSSVRSLFFLDQNIGWVAGSTPMFLKKTTDGGNTWTNLTPPGIVSIYEMFWLDQNTGWVVGSGTNLNAGEIRKTTDGGISWLNITPSNISCTVFTDLYFISSMVGYVTGYDGDFIKTTDGGATWQDISLPINFDDLHSIHFAADGTGLLTQNTLIRRTVNGGTNWSSQTSDVSNVLYDIYVISADHAIAVGLAGEITRWGCTTPAPTGADVQVFCAADSPTLEDIVLSGQGIVWYPSLAGGSEMPAATTLADGVTYYAAQMGGSNCISPERFAVTVQINDVDNGVSQNGNTLSSLMNNATYQWINCNDNQPISNAAQQSFTPVTSGSYAVEVTSSGCTETSACIDINISSVNTNEEELSFLIFPNPTDDLVNIEVGSIDQQGAVSLLILNATGQILRQQPLSDLKSVLSTEGLAPGLYLYEVISEKGSLQRGKLVVK